MKEKRNTIGFSEHNDALHDAVIEAIEQSFVLLAKEKPYEKITVSAIVERAGVSRSAFYRNYETKDALLKSFVSNITGKLTDMVFDNLSFKAYWLRFFDVVSENKDVFSMIISSGRALSEYFRADELKIKAFIEIEGEWVKTFMSGGIVGLIEKWEKDGWCESAEEMAEILVQTVGNIGKSAAK